MPTRSRLTMKSERGQSFMELGISLVFLLVLLTVVIDLGWAFYTMIALRDTAQEAASYGIMCPDDYLIRERLRNSTSAPLNASDIDNGNVTVEFLDPLTGYAVSPPQHGDLVRVSVTIQHQIIVPFVATFIGTTSYPLSVNVSDTLMVDHCP
jgi:Flp pilus assembly protein TadG